MENNRGVRSKMQKVSQIIYARWVIPVIPKNTVFENYALIIEGDTIIDLLPQDQAKEKYHAKTVEHFNNHALMPGMINAHTHLAMSYFRGLADDLPLESWLNEYIWPAESATLSPQMVFEGTTHALAECIRSGVTTANDHYFFPESVIKAVDQAGTRAVIANCIFNFPLPWINNTHSYFAHTKETISTVASHPRIYPAIGPHAPYTVDDTTMEEVHKLVDLHKLPMHIHMHESKAEVETYQTAHGKSALEHFYNKGWLNQYTIAVHMTQLSQNELDIVEETKLSVVHCPESNMKLSSGAFPWKALADKNINIALGTDGAASNNDLDMFGEMKSASFLAKLQFGADALKAHQVLEMATINGAKALHIDHLVGSLEKGKKADFIVIDLDQPETQPVYNPIAQIAYAASRSQVTDVWCDGKKLLCNYNLTTIDLGAVTHNQKHWAEKVVDSVKQKNV